MHAVNVPHVPSYRVPDKYFANCRQIVESLQGLFVTKVIADKHMLLTCQVVSESQRMLTTLMISSTNYLYISRRRAEKTKSASWALKINNYS